MSSYEPPRPLSSLKFSISQSRNYLVYFGVISWFQFFLQKILGQVRFFLKKWAFQKTKKGRTTHQSRGPGYNLMKNFRCQDSFRGKYPYRNRQILCKLSNPQSAISKILNPQSICRRLPAFRQRKAGRKTLLATVGTCVIGNWND